MKDHRTILVTGTLLSCVCLLCMCSSGTDPDSSPFVPPVVNFAEPAAAGSTFYVDPVNGSPDGDGSQADPWRTIEEVFDSGLVESYEFTVHPWVSGAATAIRNEGAPVRAGDELVLLSGYHGELVITDYQNQAYITIRAMQGHTPTLSRISLTSCRNWHIKGLTVSPSLADPFVTGTMASLAGHSWHGPSSSLILNACSLYTATDVSAWTAAQWDSLSCNGVSLSGDSLYAVNNVVRNTNFGLSVSGNECLALGNTIANFSGDGMRGLGNDLVFEGNTVMNCYDVNDNHDDGFQSWSINDDPPRERVVLRGNRIINYEDPGQPLRGTLQGIGCFDGPYVDWVIENNVIVTDHWHGITLMGAFGCRIVNNTVMDPNDTDPGPCWISIADHKDGTPSANCVVRNNIAATFLLEGGVVDDHNYQLTDRSLVFVDWAGYDLHLKSTAPVIDSGGADDAPVVDFDGNPRPSGSAIDIGAYEFQAGNAPN
jgi:hypothetical protein